MITDPGHWQRILTPHMARLASALRGAATPAVEPACADRAPRPRVLVFVGTYLPGYKAGGPTQSVANLVEHLGADFDFYIITADRDMGDTEPYSGIANDAWNTVGKARVFYTSPRRRSLRSLSRLMRETPHDLVYVNSFFSPVFTLRPLLARALRLAPRRPVVIAPRGEFSEGALALKSRKKRPYIWLSRVLSPYRDLTWQAASEHEVDDIRRTLGGTAGRVTLAKQMVVAPALPSPDDGERLCTPTRLAGDPLRIVFLSRISRMKNLDFAIRVLWAVETPVELSIYGVIEDQTYWRECEDIVDTLETHIAVRYQGPVPHDSVPKTLSAFDLFLLPTRGENYGHVIHEALAAGLPVLISDQTPWRDLVDKGVGWDLPLNDPAAFVSVIEAWSKASPAERTAQAARSRAYAMAVSQDAEVEAQNRALFMGALGLGKRSLR